MADDRCRRFGGFTLLCLPEGYIPCHKPNMVVSEAHTALCKEGLDCSLARCTSSGTTRTCTGRCASWQGGCRVEPPTKACSTSDSTCYQFTNGCLPDGYRDCDTLPIPPYPGPITALCNEGRPDAGVPDAGPPPPPTWVSLAKGTFTMGSPTGEPCRQGNEDQHQVTLTHAFEIQSTEVTEGQFSALMGYFPAPVKLCGSTCPMHEISWHEAAAYCNALSQAAGKAACYSCSGSMSDMRCKEAPYSGQKIYDCPGYRLPTEAEWEYAYRAGTQTAYYNGTNDPAACSSCTTKDAKADTIGWSCGENDIAPHPVGQKLPNAWGLHDMAGNVWEWCHDAYQDSLGSAAVTDPWGAPPGADPLFTDRVLRGGSWADPPAQMRAARRGGGPAGKSYYTHGFRCARTTP